LNKESMQGKYVTCVKNIEFHAAHATPVNGTPLLHGHTFIVNVCIEGRLTEKNWVIDFTILSDVVKEIIDREYNFRLLLNRKDASRVKIIAPFEVKIAYIDGPPTAESLARDICQRLNEYLSRRGMLGNIKACRVTVCEGSNLCAEHVTYLTME